MPELPEVETVVRSLTPRLVGFEIAGVDVFKPLVLKSPQALFVKRLVGQTVNVISRHGKSIFWTLSNGQHVKIHLGMSGVLLVRPKSEPVDPYVRVRFQLKNSDADVLFRDVRQFGRLELSVTSREESWGPDMWLGAMADIVAALRKKKGMLKHALLNQHVVAGLGNIYVDETLFKAKLHPLRRLETLSDETVRQLGETARAVLGHSLESGGTSFRDYVNAEGKRGDFMSRLLVYGREGKLCSVCGTKIRKIVVSSRGTHFCPTCQKRPRTRTARRP